MQLLAISDLHLGHKHNRAALDTIRARPDDWLIVAGDVGETEAHLDRAWQTLVPRFRQIVWVPGNHELWSPPGEAAPLRGVERYERMVARCRAHGVLTPEDPYPVWPGEGPPTVVAPVFALYDYTFAPAGVPPEQAVAWAAEHDLVCADELLLHPDPHPSRPDWCRSRVADTEARLGAIDPGYGVVLVSHFPLRYDLAHLPRIPRFSIWCGTRLTESWHLRFRASVVVSGHLHLRSTAWRDGVRFEEVSLGYPRQWKSDRGIDAYLRRIL